VIRAAEVVGAPGSKNYTKDMPTDPVVWLQQIAQAAENESWFFESNDIGPDVDAAIAQTDCFRESKVIRQEDTLVYELEWLGPGTCLADLDDHFFRMYGFFAEQSNFIHRAVENDAVTYSIISGSTDSNRHGHRLHIRITGERIRQQIFGDGRIISP
jgi:hypothetical protein